MTRDELLKLSGDLISGARHQNYGDASDNFARIADGWQIIVENATDESGRVCLTVGHVALMMDWLKTARLLNNMADKDGWVDKIGYSALGGEMCIKDPEPQK